MWKWCLHHWVCLILQNGFIFLGCNVILQSNRQRYLHLQNDCCITITKPLYRYNTQRWIIQIDLCICLRTVGIATEFTQINDWFTGTSKICIYIIFKMNKEYHGVLCNESLICKISIQPTESHLCSFVMSECCASVINGIDHVNELS